MPKTASRSSIKRTREAALPSNIFTTYQLQMNDGSTKSFPAVAPVDLLEYIVMTCMTFADFMKGLMDSTDTTNWGIVIYTDEILPGAQLKINNNRKLVSFYWSFVQFGAKLGVEDCWLHLATIRRSWMTSAKCGWSQVFKELCKLFFKKPKDLASGVVLNLVGHGPCTLFAKIGAVIVDAPALQSVWGWKGATGWKCCFFLPERGARSIRTCAIRRHWPARVALRNRCQQAGVANRQCFDAICSLISGKSPSTQRQICRHGKSIRNKLSAGGCAL